MKDYKVGDTIWLKEAGCCLSHSRSGEHTIREIDNRIYLLDDGYYHSDDCFDSDVPEDFKPVQIVNVVPEDFKPVQIVLNLNTPEELMYVWGVFNSPLSHVMERVAPHSDIIPDTDIQLPLFDAVNEAAIENGLININ